jgi:crossover junction endodeoxyribonuclease RuvC
MIIFGIDPGTSCTGYGVIEASGNRMSYVECGVIRVSGKLDMAGKLAAIFDGLTEKLTQYEPQRASIEEAFYAKNVHTTLVLGQARGVAILAAQKSGASVAEYSPREIKKAVAGNGNAAKNQVEYMMKMLLGIPAGEHPADAYDALAAALCDFRHQSFLKKICAATR